MKTFSGYPLAEPADACLFSSTQFFSVIVGRHVIRCHQLLRVHLGTGHHFATSGVVGFELVHLCACVCMQASSPVVTELETIVMNWLGQIIGLPEEFLHLRHDSPGGGVIQVSKTIQVHHRYDCSKQATW